MTGADTLGQVPASGRGRVGAQRASITETLADFVASTTYEDLPPSVVHETKRILLDVIGCAVGSHGLDKGRLAVQHALAQGGIGESTILGTREKVPAAVAAFANAELIHASDYCPILPPAHVSPFVTSPALALAEREGATGKGLILAVALAHEVASRVGLSLASMRVAEGGIAPSWGLSFDSLGAAVGAAKAVGLDRDQVADSIGLAGYFAPVPSHNKFLSTPEGGGMAKYGPAGWTSQGGVTAATLAAIGYEGDRTLLDGPSGFAAMVGSSTFDDSQILGGLGSRWNLLRVMYKRWPCAGNFQSPLGALSQIIEEHDLRPDEIDAIHVENEAFALLPRFRFGELRHNVDTQTNVAYLMAVAAHRVPVSTAWQASELRDDPSIRALMAKVSVAPYAAADDARHAELVVEGREYIERRPSSVSIRARGTAFVAKADHAYWLVAENEEFRATDEDLIDKFTANASGSLGDAAAKDAARAIMQLDALESVADLLAMLSRPGA